MTSPNQGLPSLAPWDVKSRDTGNEVDMNIKGLKGLNKKSGEIRGP